MFMYEHLSGSYWRRLETAVWEVLEKTGDVFWRSDHRVTTTGRDANSNDASGRGTELYVAWRHQLVGISTCSSTLTEYQEMCSQGMMQPSLRALERHVYLRCRWLD